VIGTAERELTVQVTAGRGRARRSLVRRAVAGACSKAGLPIDRIDDAVLIVEALLADRPTARADEVHLLLTARPGSVELLLGPLPDDEAQRLLGDVSLPIVGPVIAQLATSACAVEDGSHLLVVVAVRQWPTDL
jgi:hypothetical protein